MIEETKKNKNTVRKQLKKLSKEQESKHNEKQKQLLRAKAEINRKPKNLINNQYKQKLVFWGRPTDWKIS